MSVTSGINLLPDANYFAIIPQWSVSIELPQLEVDRGRGLPPQQIVYRVSESDLDSFLHVLIYNKVTFHATSPNEHEHRIIE
jgi:hypothetical protein